MRKIWITAIASLAVHSAPLLFLARSPGAIAVLSPSPPTLAEPVDRWAGNTADLGGSGQVYDVSVDPPGGEKPSVPAPAPPPPPAPVAPAPPKDAVPIDGETKPPPPKPRKPKPAPSASAVSSTDANEPPSNGSPGKRPGDAAEHGGGNPGGGSFGAEGPGSVRDLGKAFTRAIPVAGQGDPAWSKLATGDAGVLEFTINIDETGHIKPWTPPTGEAPKQLVALVKRTLPLLEAGTFGLRPGAVSAGTEVLRIHATLSDVDASEAGGAAKLSHDYDHGKGKAAFTLTSGRHVEITVEVVKVTEGG
jgi:hypothetical protein